MKAEDLMIGDWVDVNRSEGWRQFGKIIGVNEDYAVIRFEDYDDDWDADLVEFEPIPLTPEILEKNGFKPIYTDKSAYLYKKIGDKDDDYDSATIDLQQPKCCRVYSLKYKKTYEGSIVYVHDLQHALRFCGIDKNIEL